MYDHGSTGRRGWGGVIQALVQHARWPSHGDALLSAAFELEEGTCRCMVSTRQGETYVAGMVDDTTGKILTVRASTSGET
jgi:hypothetical protein